MIPTVGRMVYFKSIDYYKEGYPVVDRAAAITEVHSDTVVDLHVMHESETQYRNKVEQGQGKHQWDWMPFQKGQAAKTEELEKKLQDKQE
jgi:hypothetical protein